MTADTKFEALDLDSLDVVEVVLAIEEEFALEIPDVRVRAGWSWGLHESRSMSLAPHLITSHRPLSRPLRLVLPPPPPSSSSSQAEADKIASIADAVAFIVAHPQAK